MEENIQFAGLIEPADPCGEPPLNRRDMPAEMKDTPARAPRAQAEPVWQVEVDQATPTEWGSLLDRFEDANVYQTWSYGEVRWGKPNLSHLVLRRNGEVAAIAQLRIYHPAKLPFGVAYLRWGPLFHRRGHAVEPEVARQMAHALRSEYASRRGLFLRILPNAFAGTSRSEVFQAAFSGFAAEPHVSSAKYRTFVLNLEPSLDDLRKALDKKWRNQLSKAERNGLSIVESTAPDALQKFLPMYAQMRSRKNFETTVNAEEFRRMQESLPASQRMRVLMCEEDGEPAAGIVVSAMGDSGVFLLGATSDRGLNSRGSFLLHWTFVQWLKANGFRNYDLGGIDPEANPGVYHFKEGLSGADLSHIAPYACCVSPWSAVAVRAVEAARKIRRALRRKR
jgi:lipid II:glycine glycyltransferase (peptidoglycan interpeptide bridge formation enzyme)